MNGVSKIFREFKEKTLLKCNEEFNHIKFIVQSSTASIISEYVLNNKSFFMSSNDKFDLI